MEFCICIQICATVILLKKGNEIRIKLTYYLFFYFNIFRNHVIVIFCLQLLIWNGIMYSV